MEEAHHEDESEELEPIEFKNSTLAETVEEDIDEDKEEKSVFWNGIVMGVLAWLAITIITVVLCCYCCKRDNSATNSSVSDPNQYG